MIVPAANYFIVKKVVQKTVGDMVLPDTDTGKWEIVAIPSVVRVTETEFAVQGSWKVGQIIYILEFSGKPVLHENETYYFVDFRNILGVEDGQ